MSLGRRHPGSFRHGHLLLRQFQTSKIYELIYPARDPKVMGLGLAATRDFASFLRYEKQDPEGNTNPLAAGVQRIYATGASQTGGYLRDFMYLGFNEDESHRKVFDGVIPTIAGTVRVFLNVRFADPNIWSDQDDRHDFLQTSYPPFTYGVTTDAVTGIRDSVLKRPATDPYVFQIDSATEFWQLRASLNTVDGAGRNVPIPKNVRLYFVSSTAHGFTAGGLLTRPETNNAQCQNPVSSATADPTRALLVAMDAWVDKGVEPPPSNYPLVEDGTLVTVDEARKTFPAIPHVAFPPAANDLPLVDFGATFGKLGGILSLQPPLILRVYKVLVPKPDADGLDIAGVRSMQIRAPLGTSLGWNLRVPGEGGPNLCGLSGSYLPFAATKAEMTKTGDARMSLEERYGNREGFVAAVQKATKELSGARFLLPEDAERYVEAARKTEKFTK
jgi:Alpha/beta hydrolase domain